MEEKEKQLTDAELDKVSGGEEIPHVAEEEDNEMNPAETVSFRPSRVFLIH